MDNDSNNNNGAPENPAEPYLLTEAYVLLIETPVTLEVLPGDILTKIQSVKENYRRPYVIEPELYTDVYITSDIHADLVKFDSLLMGMGLIRREPLTPELAE